MFTYNAMTTISAVLTIACLVYLVGLGLFVLTRKIIIKHKAKKEIKKNGKERVEKPKQD